VGSTPQSVAVDPSGKFLLVADNQNAYGDTNPTPDDTGVIVVFAINQTTGLLTTPPGSGSPFVTASAPGAAPSYVTVDPSDLYAFGSNQFLPANGLVGFTFNNPPASGNLTPTTQGSVATGANPIWVTVDPLDRFVYVSNNNDGSGPNSTGGTISAYTLGTGGALTAVAGSPFHIGAAVQAGEIAIDYTGRFLYVTDSNGSAVYAFSISATDGSLTALAGSPYTTLDGGATFGFNPFGLSIDPSGHFLYTANSGDGTITEYTTNPVTGVLTQVTSSPITATGVGTNAIVIQ